MFITVPLSECVSVGMDLDPQPAIKLNATITTKSPVVILSIDLFIVPITPLLLFSDYLLNLVYFSSDSLLENDKTDVVRMIKDHDIAAFEFLAKDHDDDKDITCTSKYVGNPNEKNKRVCR